MFIYILYILAVFITIYFVLKKKKIEEALTLAINDNNGVIKYSENDKTTSLYDSSDYAKKFTQVITSGKDHLWALDGSGKSWHKTLTSSWEKKSNVTFKELTADDNHVWGLTTPNDYKVYKRPVNGSGDWVDEGDDTKNKKFIQMSASGKGWIWAVDQNNVVWKKEKGTTNWINGGGTLKQVSGGKQYIFALKSGSGSVKNLYKKKINGSGAWNFLSKKLKYVSGASNTYLWGVDTTGKVVRAVKPVNSGSVWEEVPHGSTTSSSTTSVDSSAAATAATEATEREFKANQRSTPAGTSTGTCSLNCAAPTKITGSCEGVSTLNPNPFAKDISGTIKYFKSCPYTCLGRQDTGWKDYGPVQGITYDKDIHGCRYTQQCKNCGTVDIEAQGEMKEKRDAGGNYDYVWKDAESTETRALPFGQNRQLTQCEIDKMQGLHNNNCPPPTKYTSQEEDNYNTDGTVNAADTTMANMFLDINNPHNTGTRDMSLEDYYNRRLLINSGENRLGGSKSAYTNKYKPQDRFGKIRFFNSVWKLF